MLREMDSNPRYLSVRRFSRPVQSTNSAKLPTVRHRCDNVAYLVVLQIYVFVLELRGFSACCFLEKPIEDYVDTFSFVQVFEHVHPIELDLYASVVRTLGVVFVE